MKIQIIILSLEASKIHLKNNTIRVGKYALLDKYTHINPRPGPG